MNINKVTLAGRLTRDPELKYTSSGTAIADFSLAVTRFYKDQAGQSQEEADFIDVTAFGRSAEIIQKNLRKGNSIYVEGRLKLDQWTDKQSGQTRSKLKVIAESMQFVGPRAQSNPTPTAPLPQRPTPPVATPQRPATPRDPDLDAEPGDIPF